MKTLAVQYLEYAPPEATRAQVREWLRQAFELLPINIVILGWDLPPQLEDVVAEETARHNATLYRWHPLLASDAGFALPDEWQPVNLRGEPVPGFKGLPEFTFLCPNRADVQDWIAERIEVAAPIVNEVAIELTVAHQDVGDPEGERAGGSGRDLNPLVGVVG